MNAILTEPELARIKEAISAAETRTSGEIVPYIVAQSDKHEVALWRGAGLAALLAYAVILGLRWLPGWGAPQWLEGITPVLVIVLTGVTGAVLTSLIPALKRRFAGRRRLIVTTHRRAVQAFLEKEVFLTRERTGILLFVSLLEHRIEVIGDTGINAKVDADDWTNVVATIQKNIKLGKLADGLVEGITECGSLLEKAGVAIRSDDTNELADDVTFGS